MRFRDRTGSFYKAIGWGRVGYRQEPIHVFNDEYTARPMAQPFDRAWQGFQKHQEEADMVTSWNRVGYRNSYQTTLIDTQRFQQDGSYHQFAGSYGIVPATQIMTSQSAQPQPDGMLADLVRAVKRTWNATPNGR